MTIIAVRNGIMARDSLYIGNGIKSYGSKIWQSEDIIIGWAGNEGDCFVLRDWFLSNDKSQMPEYRLHHKDEEPSAALLVLYPDNRVEIVYSTGHVSEVISEFEAIGSGAIAAIAAMHMGADAQRAAEIACIVSDGCGGEVVTARFRDD